jgi:hypothetical protein
LGTGPLDSLTRDLDRRWMALVLLAWAAYAAHALWWNWNGVRWLSLGDTDDNMRLMQVRALLAGQDWYDLRQYRLNPPQGFDIHWSRIVDLPLAGLILFFRLFTSPSWAERIACGVAPLLPLSIVMLSLAAAVRRLVHPLAWPLAIVILFCAVAPMQMFAPERIDHHGWQLAMLALTLAGLTDPRPVRSGATVGLASAVSLSIGLEMLPYCAMAGGILALRWVGSSAESTRLQAYAAALGGGSALGFALFASHANRVPRCDALTPVWLSVTVAGGGLLLLLARANPRAQATRLGLAAAAALALALLFAIAFPQCLGRPEQVSDELARNWLANVKEARPIYTHPFRLAFPVAALPVIGLIGRGRCSVARARDGPLAPLAGGRAVRRLCGGDAVVADARGTRGGDARRAGRDGAGGGAPSPHAHPPLRLRARGGHGGCLPAGHGPVQLVGGQVPARRTAQPCPRPRQCRDGRVHAHLAPAPAQPLSARAGVHDGGPRPPADHRHPSRRDRGPLSSQR